MTDLHPLTKLLGRYWPDGTPQQILDTDKAIRAYLGAGCTCGGNPHISNTAYLDCEVHNPPVTTSNPVNTSNVVCERCQELQRRIDALIKGGKQYRDRIGELERAVAEGRHTR